MAFNNWPYTNFQDLNLGWIISTYKTALNKALEALGKTSALEAEVGTYTDQINAATLTANQASSTANQAMSIASNANEVLFISADSEDKAVNFVTWSQGESGYVTALDIYNAIVVDHKVPIFMDRNQYIYEMAGYETDPNSPLTITRFKFTKNSSNREDIVWIDRTGSITYTHIDGGAYGFPVVFNYVTENGRWVSDKTYAEILAAINSGRSIFLTVKIDGETRELINNAYINKSSSGTYIALGYSRGFDNHDSPYYTNTDNLLVYYTINSSEFISVQRVFTVPSSSTQITGRVLTVNSYGKAEWMPASGGGGASGAVLYDTQQNLTDVQKAQARDNIGANSRPLILSVTENNGVFSVDKTAAEIRANLHNLALTFGLNEGVYSNSYRILPSGPVTTIIFTLTDPKSSSVNYVEFDIIFASWDAVPSDPAQDTVDVLRFIYTHNISGGSLPSTANANANDFLMLDSNKNPAWVAVPNAANVTFGGV